MKVSDLFIQKNIFELYHYTRLENVESINNDKKIYSRSILNEKNINPEYITNSLSRSLDLYHGNQYYVFLVFKDDHPFVYKSNMAFNLSRYCIDISILDEPGVLISDRIATDNHVKLYKPEAALQHLKIEYIQFYRVEREIWDEIKKYEILIPKFIDLEKYLISFI